MTPEQLAKLRALLDGPGEVARHMREEVRWSPKIFEFPESMPYAKAALLDAQECLIKRDWRFFPDLDENDNIIGVRIFNDSITDGRCGSADNLPEAVLEAWRLDAEGEQ